MMLRFGVFLFLDEAVSARPIHQLFLFFLTQICPISRRHGVNITVATYFYGINRVSNRLHEKLNSSDRTFRNLPPQDVL